MAANQFLAALAATIALAAAAAPLEQGATATASGAGGVFTLPTPTATPDGKVRFGLGGSYWRGGDFLLPDATSQRTSGELAASLGIGGFVEAYGAIGLSSTNLFSVESRQTLVSAGDSDLGVKLLVPGSGPFSAGILLQADLPSGIGGPSFKGAGGRGAALLGYAGEWVSVSAIAGYRFDNTYRLEQGTPATFPAFALGLSSYDVAYGGATLQVPLRYATPAAEIVAESPVGRQTALPEGERPLRARVAFGFAQVHTGVPSVTLSAALQLSLASAGRLDQVALPAPGFAPDPPWTIVAGLTWTFDRPLLPRNLKWHEPQSANAAEPPAMAASPMPVARGPKAVLHVVVLDARTQLPLAGAWVSFLEGSDVGGTTGPEGKVRVEAEAGAATMAVARDGYELLTEPISLSSGAETHLTVQLQPVAPDATIRGRLVGEDGTPLRAAVFVSVAGTLPALPIEPTIFEGSFSIGVQHGSYEVNAVTPGYRATPLQVDVRPGETVTRDLALRRIAGEPRVRVSGQGVELAAPVAFAGAAIDRASLPVLAEIAQALRAQKAALEVIARVAPSETADEAEALRLSDARARAAVEALREKGVKAQLSPRGSGIAKPGQPLFELKVTPLELPLRGDASAVHPALASRGAP